MSKRICWTGATLRSQSVTVKAGIAQALLEYVWPMLQESTKGVSKSLICHLIPNIFAEFILDECVSAHELSELGGHDHKGKMIFTLT